MRNSEPEEDVKLQACQSPPAYWLLTWFRLASSRLAESWCLRQPQTCTIPAPVRPRDENLGNPRAEPLSSPPPPPSRSLSRKPGTVEKGKPRHVLSPCKAALSQGRYTWRHNRVLQELAAIISTMKGETTLPKTTALIYTTEGAAKSWHGRPKKRGNQCGTALRTRCNLGTQFGEETEERKFGRQKYSMMDGQGNFSRTDWRLEARKSKWFVFPAPGQNS
ncbi:hypothetical protein RRG08_051713 [Elysia crispata]|uniref:Uncharacterized protein n=1 Tax=Elysia crispata TaxID=231223 RepID=A0AAE1BAX6_9GAST|nr:hypothetical protein RRG08_051713 [Elysia crispata]